MRYFLYLITVLAVSSISVNAQNAHCGFDEHLERMLYENPSGSQVILDHQHHTRSITQSRLSGELERGGGGPRIIPTVFHVIHQGGSENISYAQIEDQIRVLNEDFRRLNGDTVNTRSEFLPVAADANVEFRLAKIDPQGNCTDGVVRVFSPLTDNASDDSGVKGLSYWDSNKYYNVWVVRSIDNDGQQGTVLGYAQFPGFGGAATDGVVVRSDRIGTIGSAAAFGDKGRVLTHETGHWLGLLHTFQGGCNGGFFGEGIDDTPPQAEATPSNCPLNANTCSNDNPDLPDMVENYMDYSNGACQNTFTLGQKDAMDAVLNGTRAQIHSTANLNATGVLLSETPCAPKALFFAEQRVVCAGNPVTFTDNSYNGEVTTYSWSLPGATPNTASAQHPTVQYDQPGTYDVTLTVTNAQGSDTYTIPDYITVLPATAQQTGWFSFEGFEESEEEYLVISDELGNTWQETDVSFTGSRSIFINNYSGNPAGSIDEFQLPSVDLTQMNDPDLYFRLSYRQRSGASDKLRVLVSDDCGQSWSLRYNRSGASLATVSGTQGSPFTPTSEDDWDQVSVNLSTFASAQHLLVKFQCTSDAGNNMFIDDIQISGSLGIQDENNSVLFDIMPNPMVDRAELFLSVREPGTYRVSVSDLAGKEVATLANSGFSKGDHRIAFERSSIPAPGMYMVLVQGRSGRSVKRFIVR